MSAHPGAFEGEAQLYVVSPTFKVKVNLAFERARARFMLPLLVRYGVIFKKAEFDLAYPHFGPQDICFTQAAKVSLAAHELTYCEGLMLVQLPSGEVIPMVHAWCCKPDGTVVDPTCYLHQSAAEVTYIGVPVYRGYLARWHQLTGYFGLLDGHHEYGKRVGVYCDHPAKWLQHLPAASLESAQNVLIDKLL